MRYRVEKCRGSKFYRIVKTKDDRPYTSIQFDSKKKALKYCASLEGIEFKEYMKLYRKENDKAEVAGAGDRLSCGSCGSPIYYGAEACPDCGKKINWEALGIRRE